MFNNSVSVDADTGGGRFGRVIVFCFVFLGLFGRIGAQQTATTSPYFSRLSQQNGLLDETNSFIYRDSRGFVWISSMTGLNRFDGSKIKTYASTSDSTAKGKIYGTAVQSPFLEDKNGDIWFCTYEAINVYRRKTDDFAHFFVQNPQNQFIDDEYYAFHLDQKFGQLWTKAGDSLYIFDIKTRRSTPLHRFNCLRAKVELTPDHHVRAVYAYDWMNEKGVMRYAYTQTAASNAPPQYVLENTTRLLDKIPVHDLLIDQNTYWAATPTGLIGYDWATQKTTNYTNWNAQKIHFLRSLAQLSPHQIAVGTNQQGYFVFDTRQRTFVEQVLPRPYEREANAGFVEIRNMYVDTDKNLWISDWDYGVAFTQLREAQFRTIPLVNQPQKFHTRTICPLKNGRIWVGSNTADEGIFELDAQFRVTRYFSLTETGSAQLPKGQISTIFEDTNQRIWLVVERKAIYFFDNTKQRFVLFATVPGALNSQVRFVELSNRQVILIGKKNLFQLQLNANTGGGQLVPFEPAKLKEWGIENEIEQGNLCKNRFFCINDKHKIFVFDVQSGFQLVKKIDLPPLHSNLTIGCHSDWIWWTTNQQLEGVRLGSWETLRFGQPEAFPNDYFKSINMIDGEQIWLSAANRLYLYNIRQKTVQTFLPDINKFQSNSTTQLPDGTLLFGGVRGLTIVNPREVAAPTQPPIVHLLGIQVNDAPFTFSTNVVETDYFEFKHTQRTLTLDLGIVTLQRSSMPKFQYQLENYDEKWVDIEGINTSIRYAQLPTGTYQLRIRAFYPNLGDQFLTERVVTIVILPPFWETTWFRLGVFGLVVGGIILGVRRRIAAVKHEADIAQQMSDVELRSLQSQMNPHFIFNAINSANALILKKENDHAIEYLTDFSGLMRNILESSAVSRVRLEKEIEILEAYLKAEQLRFDFDFDIEVADDVDEFDTQLPSMLIQPFVENAVVHGVGRAQFVPPARGRVTVRFEFEKNSPDQLLKCIVTDNGNGWDAPPPSIKDLSQLTTAQKGKLHQSRGIEITRERLILLQYLQENNKTRPFFERFMSKTIKKSQKMYQDPIQIVNLRKLDATQRGTQVTIAIPQVS